MAHFNKQLEKYRRLNKGLKSGKFNPISKLFTKQNLVLLALPVVSFGTAHAQCLGSVNGGAFQTLNVVGAGNGIAFDADGVAGNDFSIFAIGNALKIQALGGADIYITNGFPSTSASAVAFASNAFLSGANVFGTAYLAYSNGANGVVFDGATKHIGFRIGGNEGFITIQVYHTNPGINSGKYQVAILERGTALPHATGLAGNCGSLPVELTNFYSKIAGQAIHLHWATASEENNAGFEVQRSEDNGKTFQTLAFIEGNGTTLHPQSYIYEDKALRKGQSYYYRLKQIDFDGKFEYSSTIQGELKIDNNQAGVFYPNPTKGITHLDYVATTNTVLTMTVYSVMGQEMLQETRRVVEGINTLDFNFAELGAGNYFVKLSTTEGQHYQKIVVQ